MALDAIQEVTEMEAKSKARHEAAVAQAKQRLAEVHKAARQTVANARQQGEIRARQMMAEAEKEAAQTTEEVLAQAREDCEEMKREARSRLDQAAQLIVEKVVNR